MVQVLVESWSKGGNKKNRGGSELRRMYSNSLLKLSKGEMILQISPIKIIKNTNAIAIDLKIVPLKYRGRMRKYGR